ncbi:MAG: hypothetical protein ACRD9R_00240 [Pyrinomonadaceae bacterium]
MSESQWLMRIEGGLNAHFIQSDGSSRPGTDWAIGLKRGDETHTVMVRAYLSEDATKRTRADDEYQAQTVMGYLNDLLEQGWTPDQPHEHSIVIGNPQGAAADGADVADTAEKPWWKFW